MREPEREILAAASADDVAIELERSAQWDDRYSVSVFVGPAEMGFDVRGLEWIGQWLGMLELELGRGIDFNNVVQLISGSVVLCRDNAPDAYTLRLSTPDHDASITIAGPDCRRFKSVLQDILQQLEAESGPSF